VSDWTVGLNRRFLLGAGGAAGVAAMLGGATAASARMGGTSRPARAGASIATPADEIVQTRAGRIRGYVRNDIHIFKGIPYAQTTAGANRFLPPQPVAPWSKTFEALAWGPVCPQGANPQFGDPEFKWLLEWDVGVQGEDCLRLNLWTPSVRDAAKRPVMVWFHGGGFSSGSAQEFPCYDGENIAGRGDVVLVSVNHRLNTFGFLDLAKLGGERYAASGAAGMLDLVAALEWVRDNIATFGGDPDNVTIFGQSGGGAKVTHLMAMPAARGLFHKAITQSGGGFVRQNNREESERLGAAVVAELGLTSATLARIGDVPVYDLQQAVARATAGRPNTRLAGSSFALPAGPAPLIDGTHILDGTGVPAFSSGIPLLFGGTTHEIALALFEPELETIDEAGMIGRVEKLYPGRGAKLAAVYRQDHPRERPVEILLRIASHGFTGAGIISTSELLTAPGARRAAAYRFLFDWRTPALDGRPYAKHNSDIAFAFDNVEKSNPSAAGGAAAVDLGHRMCDAWTAFARTGSPNHRGLPAWQPISATRWPTMVFNTPPHVEDMVASTERRAFAAGV
jgi:para-nitrobenzyl esterase